MTFQSCSRKYRAISRPNPDEQPVVRMVFMDALLWVVGDVRKGGPPSPDVLTLKIQISFMEVQKWPRQVTPSPMS
jgi:hypothetical protein